jgi:hypothetical protein
MGCRLRWKRRGELLSVGGNYLAGQTNTRGEPNVIESITTFLACLSFVIGGAPASATVLDQGA